MQTPSILQQVEQLVRLGRVEAALPLLAGASDAGDVDALFALARWFLAGEHVRRDVPRARILLRRAVEIGHVDAALMEIALTANGSGAPADWPMALRRLREAATVDPLAAEHLALVEAMSLDSRGYPTCAFASESLSTALNLSIFRKFLTPAECAHIAKAGAPVLAPSEVIDSVTGNAQRNPVRTSDGGILGPTREDLVVGAITRRIATISKTDLDQGEPLTILRYAPGQQYRLHLDVLPGVANQRIRTVIIYLNEGFGGGETYFPDRDLRIVPRGGDAIMFDNCNPDGSTDPSSRHAGLPVTMGSKWVATRWIRKQTLELWSPT